MSAAPSHDPRRFSLVVDPSDPGCVLITIRQVRTGQPPATYEGAAAQDRLQRFCAAYLDGAGLLAHAAAARILTSADPKVPTQERLAALLDVAAERVREAGWPVSRVAEELISRGVSGVGREVPFLLEELLGTARTSGLAVDKIGPWRVVLFQDAGIFTLAARLEAATSTEADWIQLARIVWGLGAPKDPVIPIDQLAATHAIVWRWPAPTTSAPALTTTARPRCCQFHELGGDERHGCGGDATRPSGPRPRASAEVSPHDIWRAPTLVNWCLLGGDSSEDPEEAARADAARDKAEADLDAAFAKTSAWLRAQLQAGRRDALDEAFDDHLGPVMLAHIRSGAMDTEPCANVRLALREVAGQCQAQLDQTAEES